MIRELIAAAAFTGWTGACSAPAPDAGSAARPDSLPTAPPATAGWTVMLRGAGPIRFGMTAAEAATAAGVPLSAAAEGCSHVVPPGAARGLRFMVENGRIVRADVDAAGALTDRGAGVGMSEADIRRLYPEGLADMPHKYVPTGRYLVHTSAEPSDSAYRMVFETDSGRVVRFRAGLLPQVEYVEGCG